MNRIVDVFLVVFDLLMVAFILPFALVVGLMAMLYEKSLEIGE